MANRIHDIEIKNFKSIRHAKVEDCRRINVFIGYPNVGKSNILEALSLLSYLRHSHCQIPFSRFCRFNELIDIFFDGDIQNPISVTAEGFVATVSYNHKNEIFLSLKDKEIERRTVSITTPESAAGIKVPIDALYSIEKSGTIRRIEHKSTSGYEVPDVKRYRFITQDFNSQAEPTSLSFPNGSNLAEVVRHNRDLRKEVGKLFSAYNLKLIFDESANIIVQKQLDEYSAFQFSFGQIADTLQRLIFHKAAIRSNSDSILLFEEPEAHMFPPYVSKFTADVMYDDNRNQYFIATHSPFVINDFMENLKYDELSIYVVGYKKETGETEIRRLAEEELHEIYQYGIDLFLNVGNFLESE